MGFVSIKRPAIFNTTENAFSISYTAINPSTGELETRTQIIEDTVERSITNNVTNNIINTTLSIKIKDLSSQITQDSLTFDIGEAYSNDSLAVYYNGLMISVDVESKTSSGFSLTNDYSGILTNGDKLFVSYVADSQ